MYRRSVCSIRTDGYFFLQGRRIFFHLRQFPQKRRHVSTRRHGVTFQSPHLKEALSVLSYVHVKNLIHLGENPC